MLTKAALLQKTVNNFNIVNVIIINCFLLLINNPNWFAAQEFLIIINVENSCGASSFFLGGNRVTFFSGFFD